MVQTGTLLLACEIAALTGAIPGIEGNADTSHRLVWLTYSIDVSQSGDIAAVEINHPEPANADRIEQFCAALNSGRGTQTFPVRRQ